MTTRRTVLEGPRFRVDRFTLEGRDGSTTTRDLCVHPGAVVILPIRDDGAVVLIHNRRPMLDATLIELPAGTLEPGEDPARAAARELEEETGYRAGNLRALGRFYASPGITDEVLHAFVATDLRAGPQQLDATETIELLELPFDDAVSLVRDGSIEDAKTIAVLLLHGLSRAE